MKYVGTGHGDTSKLYVLSLTTLTYSEWGVNIQRDTYASLVGHAPMLDYLSCAQNKAVNRCKFELLQVWCKYSFPYLSQKMMVPCGPPPAVEDPDEDSD